MSVKFAIFSLERGASIDPWSLNPQPATMIDLGEEPLHGKFDATAGSRGRGSRIQTLGGAVDQDFGVFIQDGRIVLGADNVAMATSVITALEAAFTAVGAQYFVTDSINCWKVKFARPDGLKWWRQLFWKAQGQDVFSYEITFNVDSKEI
jgi:hypothetical protein